MAGKSPAQRSDDKCNCGTVIKFSIPAVPVAQPRQRHAVIGGTIRNYTPTKHPVTAFKATARLAASAVHDGPPLKGPLRCSIVFVMPRPKSMIWKTKPMPRVLDERKPDRDNLMKSLQDALEGILFFNDSQLAAGPVEKWIAAGDELPHVEIEIWTTGGSDS